PGGTVQFKIDGSDFGSPVALSGGQAQISTAALSVGNHEVKAYYSGNASFNSSNGTLSGGQDVNAADTTTSVSSNHNPSVFGQSVTFTATVAAVAPGSGTPGGTVQFKIDGSDFGSPVALSGGQAQISTAALSVGNHEVKAYYSGNASFNSSNGTLSGGQDVNAADTTTSVSSNHNPSVF